jgi:hypothetical protein
MNPSPFRIGSEDPGLLHLIYQTCDLLARRWPFPWSAAFSHRIDLVGKEIRILPVHGRSVSA